MPRIATFMLSSISSYCTAVRTLHVDKNVRVEGKSLKALELRLTAPTRTGTVCTWGTFSASRINRGSGVSGVSVRIVATHRFNTSPALGWASSSVTSTFRPNSISHAMPSSTKPGAQAEVRVRGTEGKGREIKRGVRARERELQTLSDQTRIIPPKTVNKKYSNKKRGGGRQKLRQKQQDKNYAPASLAFSQVSKTILGHHLSFRVLLDQTILPSPEISMASVVCVYLSLSRFAGSHMDMCGMEGGTWALVS